MTLESAKPEWRDPEFARRLQQVQRWRNTAPERPIAMAFGSSRTQMGLTHAAMGLGHGPRDPLIYNFGYRGSHSLGEWFQLERVLDAGIRPNAVLVELSIAELACHAPAEGQFTHWRTRLAISDIRRLAPYTRNPRPFWCDWAITRGTAWTTYRETILNDLAPGLQSTFERRTFVWEIMDDYGYTPSVAALPAEERTRLLDSVRIHHGPVLANFRPAEVARAGFRDLVARCRYEAIPVAFFWTPESPRYRSWYSPQSRAEVAQFGRWVESEYAVPVFPAPEHLTEEDFADGYHLLRPGAEEFSRWLADTHLKSWLAKQ